MLLKRFYNDQLAQASYLIGCSATGEALVVDPNRDVEPYVAAAEAEGLSITHVTETHIHADFVSGSRELAGTTGAQLLLSVEGGADWQYGFADQDGATPLRHGDRFTVGNVAIDVLHTPGHTPEHLSFLVTDTAAANQPMGAITGDFIFVGDVGRPDLLEKAARLHGTMEQSARELFRSLQRFKRYPDHLQIWPGHGAGSACGRALGAVPQSTLGYERIANWAFGIDSERDFIEAVLAGQPEPPKYFAQMKRINRDGPAILGSVTRPRRLHLRELDGLRTGGAVIVDTRSAAAFAGGHIPGTINIPFNRSFTTWAGWLLPYDDDVYLLVDEDDHEAVDLIVAHLRSIGLDRVAGYFDGQVIAAWSAEGRRVGTVEQRWPADLAAAVKDRGTTVVDVRWQAEWDAGHIPEALHRPLGYLSDQLETIPDAGRIVVHCRSGARSAIAASLLKARGFDDVVNVIGGFEEWARGGHPIERAATAPVGSA